MISHSGCNAEAESLRKQRDAAEAALKKTEEELKFERKATFEEKHSLLECARSIVAAEARVAELEKALREIADYKGCRCDEPCLVLLAAAALKASE